jgi:putative transposase
MGMPPYEATIFYNFRMPNYRRHYLEGHPVFVTMVTHHRRPWLAATQAVELLLEAMRWVKSKHPYRHIAHAVMPDHVHWMFEPAKDPKGNFSAIIAAAKRETTWRLKRNGGIGMPPYNDGGNGLPPYWQSRFYDHVIRNEDDFWRHLDYIHFNPVKHGVAAAPADHPHSSFKAWCERNVYDADWGRKEPDDIARMSLE